MFLGEDLLGWLLLALGAAMFVGNGLAILRPPANKENTDLKKAPIARSLIFMLLGLIASVAALGTLILK
ncbi:MAG: hypothetical protein ACJZ2F_01915 [Acidimicrobiales bacterium]|nr:hypothetical protein [Acidimicrobiaceae bacterium]|tara:strand:- start:6223 stop:6429 length:207 start_codon:yes stop_codon:yes gene_type:complete